MAINNSCLLYVIVLCSVSGALSDVNLSEYLFWKKADIEVWHEFFPSRAIEEERLTVNAALNAASALLGNLNISLARVFTFQEKELQTAIQMMEGTPAEGCVNGISDFMSTSIDDATSDYADCTADASSRLLRLNATWGRNLAAYSKSYGRAMSGVDACARNYPNRDQFDRLRSCVESMINNYLKTAQTTQAAMLPSPSMNYFESVVMGCTSSSVTTVAAKGKQFLDMLVDCAALIKDRIDLDLYKYQMSQWKGYNDDLIEQLKEAQDRNYYMINNVESSMRTYYTEQKAALEKSVVETRGLDHYQNIVFNLLNDYYNTITAVALDNPGGAVCAKAARTRLDEYAATAASTSLGCDIDMVNRTKQLVGDVFSEFRELNQKMPHAGNAALLDCLSAGYIFAPETIAGCYNLTFIVFSIDYSNRRTTIQNYTASLYALQAFFTSGGLPCGGSSLSRLLLAGQKVLYDLQRCLYSNFGTTYDVTTPRPSTTSFDPSYTPTAYATEYTNSFTTSMPA